MVPFVLCGAAFEAGARSILGRSLELDPGDVGCPPGADDAAVLDHRDAVREVEDVMPNRPKSKAKC